MIRTHVELSDCHHILLTRKLKKVGILLLGNGFITFLLSFFKCLISLPPVFLFSRPLILNWQRCTRYVLENNSTFGHSFLLLFYGFDFLLSWFFGCIICTCAFLFPNMANFNVIQIFSHWHYEGLLLL